MVYVELEDNTSFTARSVDIHNGWVAAYNTDTEDWLYLPARRISQIAASENEKDDVMGVEIKD